MLARFSISLYEKSLNLCFIDRFNYSENKTFKKKGYKDGSNQCRASLCQVDLYDSPCFTF